MTDAPPRRTILGPWTLVILLCLTHMMAFVDRFALAAVAGPLKTAFGLNETGLGALQGLAIALPYAAVILPFGRLADRISPRPLIVGGIVAWTLGGLACAFSATIQQLWAARMLMGAGQAAFIPAALTLFRGAFGVQGLARPLSLFTAGATLGKSVALLMSGWILTAYLTAPILHALFGAPWRAVLALTAAPNLILAAALLFTPAPALSAAPARPPVDRPAGRLIRSVCFWSFALLAVAPIILIQATAAWTPVFFARSFQLSTARAALLVGSVVLIFAPLGHLIGGQLTAAGIKRGIEPGRLVALCLALACPVGLAFCLSPNLAVSLSAYGLIVMILGIAGPAGLTGVSRLAPTGQVASANALFMGLVTLVGVGLGPTLVGLISDTVFGGAAGLRYALAALLVVVPLVGVALMLGYERLWRPAPAGGPGRQPLTA